jgi:exopolyphosphatase/guanosine-5'-triphosphate,3'-diphosphate pyrophosphatase
MIQKLDVYDSEKVQDFVIRQENVTEALKKLSAMSYDERCRTKGLMPERADIIVAGIAILDSLMEYLALSEITVSDRDLSEGLLDADVLVPNEPK